MEFTKDFIHINFTDLSKNLWEVNMVKRGWKEWRYYRFLSIFLCILCNLLNLASLIAKNKITVATLLFAYFINVSSSMQENAENRRSLGCIGSNPNYILEVGEEWDVPGLGCTGCVIDYGYYWDTFSCQTNWSDGLKAGDEEWDDRNLIDDDGCSSLCKKEFGYNCTDAPTININRVY